MSKASVLVSVLFSLISSAGFAAGFSGGGIYKATPVSGQVHFSCHNGAQSAQRLFYCYDVRLLPYEYDFFIGPAGVNADTVTLTAHREDGSTKSKSSSYDASKGRSANRFNLWIRSLTQIPLLDNGKNQIDYILTKNGQEVSHGTFEVEVERGPGYQCTATGYYNSSNMNDCEDQFMACSRFFYDRNYCLPN